MRKRTWPTSNPAKILLLGSGELGKELTISLKRLGQTVIAVDRYAGAPAMQVADGFEVINMLDAGELARVVQKHRPDFIVPEIEAIRTEKLKDFEREGYTVIPTAEAAHLTMNRNAIRDVAARELKLKTARYLYAETERELIEASDKIGFPNVVKPVMSSSGKGQSVVRSRSEVTAAWAYAAANRRGDQSKVIVEEFIRFDLEITLLTVRTRAGKTLFAPPIGHRQERGDYQESWMPAALTRKQLTAAQAMAKKVTARLGGAGLFGVEFFIGRDGGVYFSELSPRPHDTGMVTLISQDLSEFDLHARAILGLPIPTITAKRAAASAVILADRDIQSPRYIGIEKALAAKHVDIRIFGKAEAHRYRRMGVALALGATTAEARRKARKAASLVKLLPAVAGTEDAHTVTESESKERHVTPQSKFSFLTTTLALGLAMAAPMRAAAALDLRKEIQIEREMVCRTVDGVAVKCLPTLKQNGQPGFETIEIVEQLRSYLRMLGPNGEVSLAAPATPEQQKTIGGGMLFESHEMAAIIDSYERLSVRNLAVGQPVVQKDTVTIPFFGSVYWKGRLKTQGTIDFEGTLQLPKQSVQMEQNLKTSLRQYLAQVLRISEFSDTRTEQNLSVLRWLETSARSIHFRTVGLKDGQSVDQATEQMLTTVVGPAVFGQVVVVPRILEFSKEFGRALGNVLNSPVPPLK